MRIFPTYQFHPGVHNAASAAPKRLSEPRFVIVPGLYGSGPGHWQTLWETRLAATRVEQDDWSTADIDRWAGRLAATFAGIQGSTIVIAHSFGCLALVRAWPHISQRVRGALLVAPADPARFALTAAAVGGPVDAPVHLVASRTDPWLGFEEARTLARHWRCELVDAGAAGHINLASGHGKWSAGWQMLYDLLRRCAPAPTASAPESRARDTLHTSALAAGPGWPVREPGIPLRDSA